MKFKTKHHGIREFNEEDVITFPKGLPGLEKNKKFILFSLEENDLFHVLHSIEHEDLGLLVISPFSSFKEYEFKLTEEKLSKLKISKPEDVLVLNTVTLHSKIENITTNLKAPIIINIKEKLGEQIILDNEKYLIKHPLFKEEI